MKGSNTHCPQGVIPRKAIQYVFSYMKYLCMCKFASEVYTDACLCSEKY